MQLRDTPGFNSDLKRLKGDRSRPALGPDIDRTVAQLARDPAAGTVIQVNDQRVERAAPIPYSDLHVVYHVADAGTIELLSIRNEARIAAITKRQPLEQAQTIAKMRADIADSSPEHLQRWRGHVDDQIASVLAKYPDERNEERVISLRYLAVATDAVRLEEAGRSIDAAQQELARLRATVRDTPPPLEVLERAALLKLRKAGPDLGREGPSRGLELD